MPGGRAEGAKLLVTGWAGYRYTLKENKYKILIFKTLIS
jgi:hypothetical protein